MSTVFLRVLNMSLSGAIVIAVILLARLILKNAPKKWSYALWLAAAFRLVCPVSIKGVFSLFSLAPKAAENVSGTGAVTVFSPVDYVARRLSPLTPSGAVPLLTDAPAPVTVPPVTAAPAPTAPVTAAPAVSVNWPAVLCAVWLIGASAMLIWGLVRCFRLKKSLSTATKLTVFTGLPVFRSENVETPFIFGMLKPRIYVPYGLADESLGCVLEHESCHLRRGDHIVRALSYLILSAHWFNPLCWLAFLLVGKDMELSIDEKVLSERRERDIRKEYSTTLLSFACKKELPAINPIAFGETSVKSRIKHAAGYKKPRLIISIVAALVTVPVLIACMINPIARTAAQTAPDPSVPDANEATFAPTPELTPEGTPDIDGDFYDLSAYYPLAGDPQYCVVPSKHSNKLLVRRYCRITPEETEKLCAWLDEQDGFGGGIIEKLLYRSDDAIYVFGCRGLNKQDEGKECLLVLRSGENEPEYRSYITETDLFLELIAMTREERALTESEAGEAKAQIVHMGAWSVFPSAFDAAELPEVETMLEAVYDEQISESWLAAILKDECWSVSRTNTPTEYDAVFLLGIKKDAEHNALYNKLIEGVFGDAGNYFAFTVKAKDGGVECTFLNNADWVRPDGSKYELPGRYACDLDGDGVDEYFVLDIAQFAEQGTTLPRVEDARGNVIGTLQYPIGGARAALGLYAIGRIDHRSFIFHYSPAVNNTMTELRFDICRLENGELVYESRSADLSLTPDGIAPYNDAEEIMGFVEAANTYLEHANVIAACDWFGIIEKGLFTVPFGSPLTWDSRKPLVHAVGLSDAEKAYLSETLTLTELDIAYFEELDCIDVAYSDRPDFLEIDGTYEKILYSNRVLDELASWRIAANELYNDLKDDWDQSSVSVYPTDPGGTGSRYIVYFPAACFREGAAQDTWVTVDNRQVVYITHTQPPGI